MIVAVTLSGCASVHAPPAAPLAKTDVGPAQVLAPPAALRVEGVPPLSQAVLAPIQRYSQVVGHGLADWHPAQRDMLIVHRLPNASTTQLFRLCHPMGTLEQLTSAADPVNNGRWEPRQGRFIVFSRGTGGGEAFQLFRLDPPEFVNIR